MIFHGATVNPPVVGSDVRTLPDRVFVDAVLKGLTLNSGTIYNDFVIAYPGQTIASVLDRFTNADITSQFVLNSGLTAVPDYAGITSTSYNVYVYSQALPFTSNHPLFITRA